MSMFMQSVGFGIVTAGILAVSSMGLTLQFGVTNFVNFAYGGYMSLGAYLAWEFNHALGVPFWWTVPIAALLIGLVGVIVSELVFAPFLRRGASVLYILIVSFGLSIIVTNVTLAFWGGDFKQYDTQIEKAVHIGPFLVSRDQCVIVALALVTMIAIHLLLTRTKLGKAMRAMSDDPHLARVSGIPVRAITRGTWFLSGVLAGLGGCVLALNAGTFDSNLGTNFLFVIFAAVILGGIGSPYGAILGSLVIGLALQLSTLTMPAQYSEDVAFGLLIAVLLFRPQGILRVAGKS